MSTSQRPILPLQQSVQAAISRWHNPPYRTMYVYHHHHQHQHDNHHHHHHDQAGRGVWHVQSTDGVRVWHCGGGAIVLYLYLLVNTIVFYCYCTLYLLVLLYTIVRVWDYAQACGVVGLDQCMFNVSCILYLLFCIKIVLHCHYTTPCMYWSPLGLSAHITIISEYTQNNQTKIKTSEKTFKKIPDIIWKSWEVGGDPSLDHGILNHFLTSPTDHILLTLFISHGSYLRIKKIGIPSLKGLLPNLWNPWENNAI